MQAPNLSAIKAALIYDADTGVFVWNERKDMPKKWNTRYAGKRAGSTFQNGYRYISFNNVNYYAHRLAYYYMTGEWPKEVDHINGIRGDDRISNLRSATHSQNLSNVGITARNKSGLKGAFWCKTRKRWRSSMSVNNKSKYIGYFDCPAAAHLAYLVEASKHQGQFMRAA